MIKKQQKIIKIKQKNVILMSEKIAVTLINKGFSQKDGNEVKVEYPLKQGWKQLFYKVVFLIIVKYEKKSKKNRELIQILYILSILFIIKCIISKKFSNYLE